MKIHPLQTGTVRVKNSFLHPSPGRRRQLDLFLPGAWSDPLPITQRPRSECADDRASWNADALVQEPGARAGRGSGATAFHLSRRRPGLNHGG